MDYQKLFHERKAFERETFAQRIRRDGDIRADAEA